MGLKNCFFTKKLQGLPSSELKKISICFGLLEKNPTSFCISILNFILFPKQNTSNRKYYLRFWYQVLTWVSVRFNFAANSIRSWTERYFWRSKVFSRVWSCRSVKAVRAFLGFFCFMEPPPGVRRSVSEEFPSSSSDNFSSSSSSKSIINRGQRKKNTHGKTRQA